MLQTWKFLRWLNVNFLLFWDRWLKCIFAAEKMKRHSEGVKTKNEPIKRTLRSVGVASLFGFSGSTPIFNSFGKNWTEFDKSRLNKVKVFGFVQLHRQWGTFSCHPEERRSSHDETLVVVFFKHHLQPFSTDLFPEGRTIAVVQQSDLFVFGGVVSLNWSSSFRRIDRTVSPPLKCNTTTPRDSTRVELLPTGLFHSSFFFYIKLSTFPLQPICSTSDGCSILLFFSLFFLVGFRFISCGFEELVPFREIRKSVTSAVRCGVQGRRRHGDLQLLLHIEKIKKVILITFQQKVASNASVELKI